MLTSTERLVEAATYASEDGLDWYEIFDSASEALRVITSAQREEPDEAQIVCLLSVCEANSFEDYTADETYQLLLKEMRQELCDNM